MCMQGLKKIHKTRLNLDSRNEELTEGCTDRKMDGHQNSITYMLPFHYHMVGYHEEGQRTKYRSHLSTSGTQYTIFNSFVSTQFGRPRQ